MSKKSAVTPSQHQQHIDKGAHTPYIKGNQGGQSRGTPPAFATNAGKGGKPPRAPRK
jgi:hypothetical protein